MSAKNDRETIYKLVVNVVPVDAFWTIKLILSIIATAVLLVHMQPTERLAQLALDSGASLVEAGSDRIQLIADATAAFLVLLFVTALDVFTHQASRATAITGKSNRRSQKIPRAMPETLEISLLVLAAFIVDAAHSFSQRASPGGSLTPQPISNLLRNASWGT